MYLISIQTNTSVSLNLKLEYSDVGQQLIGPEARRQSSTIAYYLKLLAVTYH